MASRIALTLLALGFWFLVLTGVATAQDSTATARSTGLPTQVSWQFNFEAGAGVFGFGNSLFRNVRPDPSGNLSENWAESYAKPSISGAFATGRSQVYGTLSAVGERTFAAPPVLVGTDASSFGPEDLSIGWRSGKSLTIGENALDFTFGRTDYTLGEGMLLYDGAADGGTRGGYWSNPRKAWGLAGIGRFTLGRHTLEWFYLERDELPENREHNRVSGANYEIAPDSNNTIGITYMRWHADSVPDRNGMSVLNLRAYLAPFKHIPDLSLGGEFARERNRNRLTSTAWMAQAAYQLRKMSWKPRLQYRYAFFEGDDPTTAENEAFDQLFPGLTDWGAWFQGEIAGEYFLANSNLVSHALRLQLAPNKSVNTGLIGYVFALDHPTAFGDSVTSKRLATELDSYTDWKINDNFTLSVVAAVAHPQRAVTQLTGRTRKFIYGMLYLAYAY